MLSEKGILIIQKLADYNNQLVTAKKLAESLSLSERSVKTYLKEVAEFCDKNNMLLDRKPGKGLRPAFSDEQIIWLRQLSDTSETAFSQKQRVNYIAYILLSGWDTYTYALFSEELNVSKNIIIDDINELESEFEFFKIKIHKTAGHGIYATGSEFDIRKALRHFCRQPINNSQMLSDMDNRLTERLQKITANNYRSVNLNIAVDTIQHIEHEYDIVFTDYTFQMLIEYLSIQLFRIAFDKMLIRGELDHAIISEKFIELARSAAEYINNTYSVKLENEEVKYLSVLFLCAEAQNCMLDDKSSIESVEERIIVYLSNVLAANLIDNRLLEESLKSFLPGSMARTRYGIEIDNPFLTDVTELYGSLYTVCFTVSRFYELYAQAIPSEDEIAFIALHVGGALHRNPMTVRAVLVGAAGYSAGNIIAGKLENRVPDVKVLSIFTSDKVEDVKNYDCDLILSTISISSEIASDRRYLQISPLISYQDEKNIRNRCFELMTGQTAEISGFSELIKDELIVFEKKVKNRKMLIKKACKLLLDKGIVTEEFEKDVLEREKSEATVVGCNIAIPHGKPEHVNESQILVMRLEHPLDWGESTADMIFLLAINFDSVNTTKAFFHDFTKLLNENGAVDRLRSAKTPHELNLAIKRELGWI